MRPDTSDTDPAALEEALRLRELRGLNERLRPGPIVLFTGPSMPPAVAAELLPAAVIAPPAQVGSIARALRDHRPAALAIVDGYYERVPAGWHKEVLLALSAGVACYGSSSMGALRAAELAPYGMVGVGEVFSWFVNGTVDADDEVAVVHGPASAGYAAASVAMVVVRATLAHAVAGGLVAQATADVVVAAGRRTWYPQRTWARLLADDVAETDGQQVGLEALRSWVDGGNVVDVKRDDAVALCRRLARDAVTGFTSLAPSIETGFETTVFTAAVLDELALDEPAGP